MALAYFDCFAGASGDMIVGALLDAGADFDRLRRELESLKLEGYELRTEHVHRSGLGGTKFHVDLAEHEHDGHHHEDPHHGHRRLADIIELIDAAALPPRAATRAKEVFANLAHAEACAHRIAVDQVHFHEVGAVDSIVDIVGACLALEMLGVDELVCSPIPTGSGTVQCAHGLLPVPAPATAELLKKAAIQAGEIPGEATTPTAAAILTTLAKSYGPMPQMQVSSIGYGAGTRIGGPLPNLLRVFLGDAAREQDADADSVVELSANIDDATGEVVGAAIAALIEGPALDAWASPIYMKKSRPAWMLSVLCEPADVPAAQAMLFSQTTTFGIRVRTCSRIKLHRRHENVETLYGAIRVKVGERGGAVVSASPEFEDCLAAARAHGASVKDVMQAAMTAYSLHHQR